MIPYYIFLSKHGMPFLQTILTIFVVHHFHPTKVMICESDPKEAAKNKDKASEAANSELAAGKVLTPPGGRIAEGAANVRHTGTPSSVLTSGGTP